MTVLPLKDKKIKTTSKKKKKTKEKSDPLSNNSKKKKNRKEKMPKETKINLTPQKLTSMKLSLIM